jgi:predicted enzyme related to lactoylglutathione lyase/catechol 2,3-dioxygenase-like lactoylglutathione lyase family enzyme
MAAAARWKELCMDTTGGEELGRFWAAALGCEFHSDGEAGYLTGPTEGHGIAMCTVPEAKSVKHRVHIDVKTPSVAHLQALGASVVRPAEESGLRWTVMSDPEGGELCAFVREPEKLPEYRFYALIVDARNPAAIAGWWGRVLGARTTADEDDEWVSVEDVPGLPFEGLVFVPVPEPKTVKNRVHWDVYGEPEELVAAGATLLRPADDEIRWHVLADPEGNEFCCFRPSAG